MYILRLLHRYKLVIQGKNERSWDLFVNCSQMNHERTTFEQGKITNKPRKEHVSNVEHELCDYCAI